MTRGRGGFLFGVLTALGAGGCCTVSGARADLTAEDPEDRADAAECLGATGDAAAATALLDRLLGGADAHAEHDVAVLWRGLEALAAIHARTPLAATDAARMRRLIQRGLDHRAELVQWTAARVAGAFLDEPFAAQLCAAFDRVEIHPAVQGALLEALAADGHEWPAVAALATRVAASEAEDRVPRAQARRLLRAWGRPVEGPPPPADLPAAEPADE